MISRVIAEFDSEEAAQNAVLRAKESIGYVYSGNIIRPPSAAQRGHYYDSLNTHADFLSATVMPVSADVESVQRKKSVSACIICGGGAVENVISLLHAMGAENIRSAI